MQQTRKQRKCKTQRTSKKKKAQAELKKAQDLWNLAARTRTRTTPYPATKEQMEANKKVVMERAKQAIKDKAAREQKAKEEKANKEKIKADNLAFKKRRS